MQMIAILPELSADSPSYRAICGQHQVTAQTSGQALDRIEAELATDSEGAIARIPFRIKASAE